ncbi:DUF5753 domain-containing protein [Actinomadura sp. LOL_016]|uniref:DUF5753 domain-containing protein n=1 Tax=unclassified Actinomadura TaxID=2626254 RepID=UPI003A807D85
MDPRRAAILAEFRGFLESAIKIAKVNFATAERLSQQLSGKPGAHGAALKFVSKSTLHAHMRGKRRQNLPMWPWVVNLWAVLVAAAVENKVDPAPLGTLKDWQEIYDETEGRLRLFDNTPLGSVAETERTVPLHVPEIDPLTTWWASYADVVGPSFRRYLNLEPLCGDIRCYETLYIPGLLQIEEYTEAVVRLQHGHAPESEIRQRVELRMLRRNLMPYGGRRVWALINEMALSNPAVPKAVMKRQLRHLLDAPPDMPVQVVPASAQASHLASGPITILRFEHKGIPDTVYLEHDDGALYPDDLQIRAEYIKRFGNLAISARLPHVSQQIIERLINDM